MTNGVATLHGLHATPSRAATAYTLTASSARAHLGDRDDDRLGRHGDQARLHDRAAGVDDGGHHVHGRRRRAGRLRQHSRPATPRRRSRSPRTTAAAGSAARRRPTHVTNGIATFTGCSYTVSSGEPLHADRVVGGLTSATATTTVTHGAAPRSPSPRAADLRDQHGDPARSRSRPRTSSATPSPPRPAATGGPLDLVHGRHLRPDLAADDRRGDELGELHSTTTPPPARRR